MMPGRPTLVGEHDLLHVIDQHTSVNRPGSSDCDDTNNVGVERTSDDPAYR